ncbi:unnamed protein product [Nippostrongylus brasiliensis]|uniref:Uncharacterized protein n=1 Tax=Nippostrongylus brasiliensis TaxID=27835 RepID=A0A0N4XEK1_NIPBR|nr:unnamed protein product [Nippostrongylus brasiliensis]
MSLILVILLLIAIGFVYYKQKQSARRKPQIQTPSAVDSAAKEAKEKSLSIKGSIPSTTTADQKNTDVKMTTSEAYRQQVASLPASTPQMSGPALGEVGSASGSKSRSIPSKKKKTKTSKVLYSKLARLIDGSVSPSPETGKKKSKSKAKKNKAEARRSQSASGSGSEDDMGKKK